MTADPSIIFEALNPFEQREWIQTHIQSPPGLQEIPLLLLPQRLFPLVEVHLQTQLEAIAALQDWLKAARKDDFRLLIRRSWIPFVEVCFPDTEAGRKTYQMAKEIGSIPRQCGIVPINQNQRFWLKTLHYAWQARGVFLAQKLSTLSPDIIQSNIDNLYLYLPDQSVQNATQIAEADWLLYQALDYNFEYLTLNSFSRAQQEIFSSPWQLFIELQKEVFKTGWKVGPAGSEINGVSQDQQNEYLFLKSRLIENRPWLEGKQVQKNRRPAYQEDEAAFIAYLEKDSLYGQTILALRSKPYGAELEGHAQALRKYKEAYLDDFQWRNGQPYKYKVTSSPQPVEGDIDSCGYLRWYWC